MQCARTPNLHTTPVRGRLFPKSISTGLHRVRVASTLSKTTLFAEGREGVKWELGLALLWTGKMGFTHWDWDLATGNGMNNYKMGMGFLFFSGLCPSILK